MAAPNTTDAATPAVRVLTLSDSKLPSATSSLKKAKDGRDEVMAKLGEIERMLEDSITSAGDLRSEDDTAESDWRATLTPSVTSRKVYLFPNQQVNVEKACSVNRLYGTESACLAEIQKLFLGSILEDSYLEDDSEEDDGPEDGIAFEEVGTGSNDYPGKRDNVEPLDRTTSITEEEKVQAYQGVQADLANHIDVATAAHSGAGWTPTHLRLRGRVLPERRMLLEEFFSAYRLPNAAEMYMLSVALRLPVNFVKQFFTLKRRQLYSKYVFKTMLKHKARALCAAASVAVTTEGRGAAPG